MPRARNEKAEKALALYRQGLKLTQIAEKLEVPDGTVRRWKSAYSWDEAKAEPRSERSQKRSLKITNVRIKNNERSERKTRRKSGGAAAVKKEVDLVLENPDLTDEQRLFCLHFSRSFNATSAYKKAYGCSYNAAKAHGFKLLQSVAVKAEIDRLKRERFTGALLKAEDVFQKYMDIAFSDMTDYLEFGTEDVPLLDDEGHPLMEQDPESGELTPVTRRVNRAYFKESTEVDGSLISEVRNGRDGAYIKLMDRQKALDWLAEHMNMATEEQKARIEEIKARTQKVEAEAAGSGSEAVDAWIEAMTAEEDNAGGSDTEPREN